MASVLLRPPTFSTVAPPPNFQLPSISWLTETWNVTHSTLPMWKSKRNVQIQYTPLAPSSPSLSKEQTDRIDDMVSYQSHKSDKISTVHGLDKASGKSSGEWDWSGISPFYVKIATSHWEVLGWGEEPQTGNKWVVTVFAKTLFTPAGIDIYSKDVGGVSEETLASIKSALGSSQDQSLQQMAGTLFEVKRDDSRK